MREFLIIATAHLLAVISPGPDTAVILSVASKHGIKEGIKTSLGIALGIGLHVTYCLIGVALILKSNNFVFDLVRIAGSLYLLWLARSLIVSSIKSKKQATDSIGKQSKSGFKKGFITNVLNPKATLFFLALFTQVVSPNTSIIIKVLYGVEMIVVTFLWFSLVTLLVGNERVRKSYQAKSWIVDLIFGLVLGILGLVVLVDVVSN